MTERRPRCDITIFVSVSDEEYFLLMNKKIVGKGGFQSLLRDLQNSYSDESDALVISFETLKRICKYVKDTGKGGFQSRLYDIFKPAFDLLRTLDVPEERP